MLMKMRNTKGFTLVELMIVVAIIGILAAIAIPAFLRSVKKSKTSEAEGVMRKIVDGSKAYFTSEQKFSAAMTGDQPWHPGMTGDTAPGMPVGWDLYVFPGGADGGFLSTDGMRANATGADDDVYSDAMRCNAAAAPTGGSKVLPHTTLRDGTAPGLTAVLNKLGVSFQDPIYFEYLYAPGGAGNTSRAEVAACANFNTGGNGTNHAISQTVFVSQVSQEVQISPANVENEFE